MLKGLVLAGGLSSRFGRNKALEPWKGITLLERSLSLLQAFDSDPLVSCRSREDYAHLKLRCTYVEDVVFQQGPLGGLYSAFKAHPSCTFLVLTCDMPEIRESMLSTLITHHHRARSHATVYVSGDSDRLLEPFPGIYEPDIVSFIQNMLDANRLSMQDLITSVKKVTLVPWIGPTRHLTNINYPSHSLSARLNN